MRIGELAALVGVSTRAVRHYHHLGLLPEPHRLGNGYRAYRLRDAVLLARIRRLAELGLALDEIRDILGDAQGRELREVLEELDADLARQQEALATRRQRLATLLAEADLDVDSTVPEPVRRIVGFDVRNLVSLALWVAGRRHGVPRGGTAVPYTGPQAGMTVVLLVVMVIEMVAVEILLRGLGAPVALRTLLLVLEGYGILTVLSVVAAIVTRPHVITADEVRIRYGAFFDLRVPRRLIAEVRQIRRYDESGTVRVDGERLAVAVGAQTNLLLELTEPVTATRPLGRRAEVRTVRFFADDPAPALAALHQRLKPVSPGPAPAS
ncbi:MerR family transcriptional regulator [Plantactinospora sp. B24E8]|uniref:MerR family transcriptional regulator n=1 Tax=Plantactinospora sp. B24E8 TaxID=3153567 RepID=UPI00325F2E30